MRLKSLFTISALAALPLALALPNPGQAESEKDERQQHEEAAEPPANRGPDRTPERLAIQHPSPPPPIAERDEQDTKQHKEEAIEREKADLIAQQGMNAATQEINLATQDMRDFAYLSAIAAIASATIAFFSFGVMALTIVLLRRANKAAFEAVSAGNEGVRATREIGKAQAQAYVHIDKAELRWRSNSDPHPSFTLTAINTGQTPARWFECEDVVFTRALNENGLFIDELKFSEIKFPENRRYKFNSLGSGKETTIGAAVNNKNEIIKVYGSRDYSIEVAGIIRYETFFGDVFESEFWFTIRGHERYKQARFEEGTTTFRREVPTRLQKAAGSLRTYQQIKCANQNP